MEDFDYGHIDYSKLWELLKKKKLNKFWLRNNGLHSSTIQKMVNNQSVNLDAITKMCFLLNCKISDIIEYVKPEQGE